MSSSNRTQLRHGQKEDPDMSEWYDQMEVTVPAGEYGSCRIEKFEVTGKELASFQYILQGRGCHPGWYTKMFRNDHLWMSDTTAERRDHITPALEIRNRGGRILIGGLGLGMIVNFALLQPNVEHVDVVEVDNDVMMLVAPHYMAMAAFYRKSIRFHNEDMFEIKWPRGTRWSVAWFDIWQDINSDNLNQMTKLRRSYAQRSDWNGCWAQAQAKRRRGY